MNQDYNEYEENHRPNRGERKRQSKRSRQNFKNNINDFVFDDESYNKEEDNMNNESVKYNIGESIIVKDTRKTGNVIEKQDNKILIEYINGEKQWVEESACVKLLLEVDPKPEDNGWGRDNFLMNEDNNG